MKKFTLQDFLKRFPTDEACLEEIKLLKYAEGVPCPKCTTIQKFYKVSNRTAYACSICGTHIYPLAGTVFEKTTTSLRLWFYTMFLMIQTCAGISAKQLQRELGVTYKTAWRMFHQIRILMADNSGNPLNGIVEVDETFVGGKAKNQKFVWNGNEIPKEVMFGMVE